MIRKMESEMPSAVCRVLAVTAVLLALGTGASAEDQRSAHLVVKVTDSAGAPIPGAGVRIDLPTDSVHPVLRADAKGQFAADLRPGDYNLEVRSPGFKSYKKPLHIEPSREQQLVTVSLTLGQCSQCVAVTAVSESDLQPEMPLVSPSDSSLPTECRGQTPLDQTGSPLFFPAQMGVQYGVSFQANHLFDASAVPVSVWIYNATGSAISLGSCSMFEDREIAVMSNSSQSLLYHRDSAAGSPESGMLSCSADIRVSIPAHGCAPVSELYLNELYRFPPGLYTVVERVHGARTPPQEGLPFQVRK